LRSFVFLSLSLAVAAIGFGCSPSPSELKKVVENNPDIVFGAIEKHPDKFIEVVNKAAREAQSKARENEAKAEQTRMEEEFKNPKVPTISDSRVVFGTKGAPITIIEYSDFQCPYCSKGYETVKKVLQEYAGKVQVIYKHLPLDFHPLAEPAAKYFEAIALQDKSKAEKFHDAIFDNQKGLNEGKEGFLEKTAKSVGVDMGKLKKDLTSESVKEVIRADMEEARKFDFSGTPGFLVNGVSLKGAYPFEEFKKIIDRQLESKK
jgi:protein-disulfide isomerase